MKKIAFLAMVTIVCSFNNVFTQTTIQDQAQAVQDQSKLVSKAYDRCALTLLWNNYHTGQYQAYKQQAFDNALAVPDKYDNNTLVNNKLSLNFPETSVDFGSGASKEVLSLIDDNYIASSIVAFWFNQQPDGTFKMDRIAKRGQYNATIEDINEAMMTKRGLAMVKDAGLNLIDKSHIIVFDIDNIKTMKEIAKARGSKASDGENNVLSNSMNPAKKNGFRADIKMYLYKVEFNDSVAAVFYNNYWINESDQAPVKQQRMEALAKFKVPVSFVMEFTTQSTGAQINPGLAGAPKVQKTKQQLFNEMVKDGVNSNMEKMERNYSGCAVKSKLKTVKPEITANIGRKEGLHVDQRYFVYEDVQRGTKLVSVRRGVIRAKKITDNKSMASSDMQPSEFYQVAGGRLNEYSMFIAQKSDMGFGVSAGFSSGAFTGPMFRVEYNLSKSIDMATKSGIKPGYKLYADLGITATEYPDADMYLSSAPDDDAYSFFYASVGFAKEFHFMHHFHFAPYIGYQYESASWDNGLNSDDPPSIAAHGIGLGAGFGFNITHYLQVKYLANIHAPVVLADESDYVSSSDAGYTDIFEGRSGLSNIFQLRILF